MIRRFLANYLPRHRNRTNQILHLIGVPLTFVVSVCCFIERLPWWGFGCFVVGYLLQFVGHAIEGNDAGEVVAIKKRLGLPYVEFAPSHKQPKSDE